MAVPCFEQMAEQRQIGIHRIEQPEVGDVGSGEFREALVFLPPHAGEHGAFRRENLEQPAGEREQILAGGEVQQGGYKRRVKLVGVCSRFANPRGAK